MKISTLLLTGSFFLAGVICVPTFAAQDEQSSSATQIIPVAPSPMTPSATANPIVFLPGQTFKDCPECPEMVVVPAGMFLMGMNFGLGEGKMLAHPATVSRSFALAKGVVTQGQWRAIMGVNPRKFNNCGDDCPCGDKCPVGSASWEDTQEFMRRLNQKTGNRYRLPSEVEWEFSFDTPSMRGLFDTSQPVFEWVERSLLALPIDTRKKQQYDEERIIRGGFWFNTPDLLHEALRAGPDAALRDNRLGLRLARTLPAPCDFGTEIAHPVAGEAEAAGRDQPVSSQSACLEGVNEAAIAGLPLTIYQPYDAIRSDFTTYQKELRVLFEYLARYPSAQLLLEGNTDDRGTNEYNLEIGQRYADSVKQYLVTQGVAASRLHSISAGEAKPAIPGHTEKARAKNRRVMIRLR
jgi:outer membrane protein OmpA-like peptidoglycan-associated protein/formylglycine-generating enzyme required for sulfatase activity